LPPEAASEWGHKTPGKAREVGFCPSCSPVQQALIGKIALTKSIRKCGCSFFREEDARRAAFGIPERLPPEAASEWGHKTPGKAHEVGFCPSCSPVQQALIGKIALTKSIRKCGCSFFREEDARRAAFF